MPLFRPAGRPLGHADVPQVPILCLGRALTPAAPVGILFSNVKGRLHCGLGGISAESPVMVNDFQVPLAQLRDSRGAGGAGVLTAQAWE